MAAIQSTFRVGQRVQFSGPRNTTVYGTVKRINPKSITLHECSDGPRGWRVKPWNLEPADANDPGAEATDAPAGQRPWRKGDRVSFNPRGGETQTGTVTRVNGKTCSVDPDNPDVPGRYYRIPHARLRPADSDASASASASGPSPEETAKVERAEWKRWAPTFGFDADDYGRTFTCRGTEYRLTGLNPRAPKYPVQAVRVSDGRGFKFTSGSVRAMLGRSLGPLAPVTVAGETLPVGTPVTYKGLGSVNGASKVTGVIIAVGKGTYEVYSSADLRGIANVAQAFTTQVDKRDEAAVLFEIHCVYNALSPENLTADGERSKTAARRLSAQLNRANRALFKELGRKVTETEAWDALERATA